MSGPGMRLQAARGHRLPLGPRGEEVQSTSRGPASGLNSDEVHRTVATRISPVACVLGALAMALPTAVPGQQQHCRHTESRDGLLVIGRLFSSDQYAEVRAPHGIPSLTDTTDFAVMSKDADCGKVLQAAGPIIEGQPILDGGFDYTIFSYGPDWAVLVPWPSSEPNPFGPRPPFPTKPGETLELVAIPGIVVRRTESSYEFVVAILL